MRKALLKSTTAAVALSSILQAPMAFALATVPAAEPAITLATSTSSPGAVQAHDPSTATPLTTAQKIALLRQKVKYVFVLFQENRSFDHYFGTYPGANGLFSTFPGADPSNDYSKPANQLGSFSQVIRNTDGTYATISPFLIPRTIVNKAGQTTYLYPEDTYSVDHSHIGYIRYFHSDAATQSIPKNDGYVLDNEGLYFSSDATDLTGGNVVSASTNAAPTSNPTLQTKQKGEVVISHIDCDTIPFLWQYADRFVLFDNFHQTATGPSTPNAIAMIAAQVGDTQWVKHPAASGVSGGSAAPAAYNRALSSYNQAIPNVTDTIPFPGSSSDTASAKPPFGPDDAKFPNGTTSGTGVVSYDFSVPFTTPQVPLTFASQMLSFGGNEILDIVRTDEHPATDLVDVQHDLFTIAASNPVVDWGWYQQGYGPEPFDGTKIYENGVAGSAPNPNFNYAVGPAPGTSTGAPITATSPATKAPEHASYIVHHNGPQYFGYLGDNPQELAHMHGLQKFYTDVAQQKLSPAGGVYYVRGGYYNNDGLLPIDPNPVVQRSTPGNDDHPNYADAQISEALIADNVNAIVNSPYWPDSAIIITYDETDGLYDHQPEKFRTWGPDRYPETGGPRIPTIVISPYAAAHTVSHVYSEHSSVVKFINELFGLVPLANLPDETAARKAGATSALVKTDGSHQTNLGPADALDSMGDLLEAFDNDRLLGILPVLPTSYVSIPPGMVTSLPHYGNQACAASQLNITPTDYPNGYGVGKEIDPPPLDFNPRPVQSPGVPYLNTNNNTGGLSTGPWPN